MKIKAECTECGYQHLMEQDDEMMILHITLYKCSVCDSTKIIREVVDTTTLTSVSKN
jgi:hypothetical protein